MSSKRARSLIISSAPSKINAAMADELDLTFTSGQDPATTAQNLDTKIKAVLGG